MSQKTPFPSIAVSESEKSKSPYYRKWVEAVVCNTFTTSWVTDYNKLAMLMNFYKVGTGSDLTGYLQTAPDGSAMPGIWTSINSVQTRIKSLLGELEERGFEVRARALNAEAIARKFEERERLRVERHLQEVAMYAEELTGLPLQADEYIPQSDRELDEYMDLNWKDKNVQILQTAVKWCLQRADWAQKRVNLLENFFIGNMVAVRNDIVRGVPQPVDLDLLKFIVDPHSTKDDCSDATYFGEADYVPLAAAAERYGLSLSEMQEAQKEYETYLGMGLEQKASSDVSYFGSLGSSLRWFKTEDGIPRCLVVKAVWRDIKELAHKNEKKEKYDKEFLQDVTGKEVKKKDEDKIIKNKIECWRQGTLIGGKFLREWGECPNQPRSLDSLEISEPPYKVWRQTKSISLVEQMVGLQMLKDIALYQLQIQMARAIGKVLIFDEAMFPEGETKNSVIGRLKADGVAFVNSKEYQLTHGNMNLFKEFDLSLSDSIAQSVSLIDLFDKQMDNITGINNERQGQTLGASQSVGVTQSALQQSSLITAPYFKGFERLSSRVANHLGKLVKMSWTEDNVYKYAPIIGDAGCDFLKEFRDISMDSFDVWVETTPPIVRDRQKLEELIYLAVQTGELPIQDAVTILMEQDLAVAIRRYTRKAAMKQIALNQQEQEMAQRDQELQAQQIQQQGMMTQAQLQNQLQLQNLKNIGNMQKTRATSRTKLLSERMRLLS